MTLKKPIRAGLVALIFGVLLSLCLSVAVTSYSPPAYAQDQAAEESSGPAVETLACNGTTYKECKPDSGDTAWMLTSMAIVLMMTVPGLALFYGGMVRQKNVGDTVMTSFAITCLISILWLFFTYSLAFREGGDVFGTDMGWFIGGFDRAGLQGILSDISSNKGNPNPLAPTIPETVYSMFQLTFAIITAALIFGSTAERMKFSAMLWFVGAWAIFVYSPIAHWVWGPDGMFSTANSHNFANVLDFAGGTVVHVNSGTAGLMCALMLGKRKDTGPAHNMILTMIGASLLWVGWFGFNAGSAVSAGLQAGMAMLVTHTATATAGFTWMIVEWVLKGKPTVIGICSGAVAGLVAITPASGFVGPLGSFWIGVAAGIICYWGCTGLKHTFGYDDALDTFGVHGVGGAAGAILTGIFAIKEYGGTPGLIEGNYMQPVYQAIGVGTVFIYDVIVTLIILKIVDMTIGLRVPEEVEREGLDLALHGETVQH
jgi:ammonium transporter, Amt family